MQVEKKMQDVLQWRFKQGWGGKILSVTVSASRLEENVERQQENVATLSVGSSRICDEKNMRIDRT